MASNEGDPVGGKGANGGWVHRFDHALVGNQHDGIGRRVDERGKPSFGPVQRIVGELCQLLSLDGVGDVGYFDVRSCLGRVVERDRDEMHDGPHDALVRAAKASDATSEQPARIVRATLEFEVLPGEVRSSNVSPMTTDQIGMNPADHFRESAVGAYDPAIETNEQLSNAAEVKAALEQLRPTARVLEIVGHCPQPHEFLGNVGNGSQLGHLDR